ncbi:MAG: FAD-binding oxidoreductase, partial [Chitinophagales bacterium]|nr:FAD-binding oxidoreductase [Chitinophagales bacterium]
MLTAWFLDQEDCDVTLHNNPEIQAASGIAAGLINPITGKRFAKTWMADALFPFANATYASIQQTIGQPFFQPINIMRLADTISQVNDWEARAQNDAFKPYIGEHTISTEIIGKLAESKGAFNIKGGAKINTAILLKGIKDYFEQKNKLVNEAYSATAYNENERIIYCNGTAIHSIEGLSGIPVIPVKGHYLVCSIPDLNAKEVIQGAVSIIPQEDGLYRIGSTYQ